MHLAELFETWRRPYSRCSRRVWRFSSGRVGPGTYESVRKRRKHAGSFDGRGRRWRSAHHLPVPAGPADSASPIPSRCAWARLWLRIVFLDSHFIVTIQTSGYDPDLCSGFHDRAPAADAPRQARQAVARSDPEAQLGRAQLAGAFWPSARLPRAPTERSLALPGVLRPSTPCAVDRAD
eukprot:SAG31_NODE_744_length_12415_cov_74.120900_3_plen_179_part_00